VAFNASQPRNSPRFQIDEREDEGRLRLTLIGELDLASAPVLEKRLVELRDSSRTVDLNLSRLEFMDSTGLQLVLRTLIAASREQWKVRVDPGARPQVMRLFKFAGVERFIVGSDSLGR